MVDPAYHDPNARPGYELRDIALGPVVGVGAAIVGALALFAVLVWWMYGAMADREAARSAPAHPMAAAQARRMPPAPRLQAAPVDDLVELRRWEDERLAGYGWVDEETGIVRVPIDRAMQLVVERGLPTSGGGTRR